MLDISRKEEFISHGKNGWGIGEETSHLVLIYDKVFKTLLAFTLFFCLYTVVIEIIQPPLQIRFIGKIYRLSAVCNEQIKQK